MNNKTYIKNETDKKIKERILSQIPKNLINEDFWIDGAHLKFSNDKDKLTENLIEKEKQDPKSLLNWMGEKRFRWELSKDIRGLFNVNNLVNFVKDSNMSSSLTLEDIEFVN